MGSIVDGQPVNAAVTNTAKLDRQQDDTAFGVISLANTVSTLSGAAVTNAQQSINDLYQNAKIFIIVSNDGLLTWDGSKVSFADDIDIFFKDSSISNALVASNSPISVSDGQSTYVTLNRVTTSNVMPFNNSTIPPGKDTLRLWTRIGSSLILWDNTYVLSGQSIRPGAAGVSVSNNVKATVLDATSTSLPSGATATIDGVVLTDGMTVLFTNLSMNNNEIYQVNGVGSSLTWTVLTAFEGLANPTQGDAARILQGTAFSNQIAEFNGTNFTVNPNIRLFNGSDYFEISSLFTSTLSDNTSSGTVFTVAYLGSENIEMSYTVKRNGIYRIGKLLIKTDGTTAVVSDLGERLNGDVGLTFSASISGSNLLLQYTTTSTGFSAILKYFIFRWSDNAGGPGGPPTYSSGMSATSAAGSNTYIQYNSGGVLGADSSFTYNSGAQLLQLGLIETSGLTTTSLTDNVSSPASVIQMDQTLYRYVEVKYAIERNGNYRFGTLTVLHDGTNVSISDADTTIGFTGVTFSAVLASGNIQIQYITTSSGFNATFKYYFSRFI